MLKICINKNILILFSLILLHVTGYLQAANANEATFNNPYHLKIFKNNSSEFAYLTVDNFIRHGTEADGSPDILNDGWSYSRKEQFYIGAEFPIQLYGMSVFVKVMSGSKILVKKRVKTLQENNNLYVFSLRAEDFFKAGVGAGIYSFEWWIGRNGNYKLAAIQWVRITN